jgi:glycosyltransferase involved in cell wall biosynthesis
LKVLFVSSGSSIKGVGTIVRKQGESLIRAGIDVDFFTINKKGIFGYLISIPELIKRIKKDNIDLIHAHYSFSAFSAALAFTGKPLVVSLMGSDTMKKGILKIAIKIFNRFSWSKVIVKSRNMEKSVGIQNCEIIPNGVDFEQFKPIPMALARKELNWDEDNKYIIFVSDPNRFEKNFSLAKESVRNLKEDNVELIAVYNISHQYIPLYMSAANVLVLTSLWEGSPNVIKEAMACNLPIVSTDVGDVKELISSTDGCYIAPADPMDFAIELEKALGFTKPTNGRENIKFLDQNIIAEKIIGIYKSVIR